MRKILLTIILATLTAIVFFSIMTNLNTFTKYDIKLNNSNHIIKKWALDG